MAEPLPAAPLKLSIKIVKCLRAILFASNARVGPELTSAQRFDTPYEATGSLRESSTGSGQEKPTGQTLALLNLLSDVVIVLRGEITKAPPCRTLSHGNSP